MNLLSLFSKNKRKVQTVLLLVQLFSPILMYTGIRHQALILVYFGLLSLVFANLTASLTK